MAWDSLPGLFSSLPDPERWLPLLRRHAQLLQEAQPEVRVTSDSPEESIRRHYSESLELLRIIVDFEGDAQDRIVDIGSGGGFPGLVVAAVNHKTSVTLVEPHKKRANLLRNLAAGMGLTDVAVQAERAEEAGRTGLRETAAVVTARAVAKLPVLLEYCAPFLRDQGLAALPRGSSVQDDVASSTQAAETLGLQFLSVQAMRPEVSEHGSVAFYRKVRATPPNYPRRPGMAEKRPL